MEWQQIIGFYHVAKLKSFTRAAEATYRTQSALTQQVKSLEEELGCQLLERIGKRKILLTPQGERFNDFAEVLFQEHDRLIQDIAAHKGLRKGRLRIAAPFTTLYHLLPEIILKYNRRYPWVELSLLDRPQKEVAELVKRADVDLGIALENGVPAGLNRRQWKRVEPVLLTPLEHPLLKLRKISLAEIVRYPLILPPKSGEFPYRIRIEELFREKGLKYSVIMESSNVELSALYAEKGLGISFASIVKGLPAFKQKKLKHISLEHLVPCDHLCVITRSGRTMNPVLETFQDMLFAS